MPATLRTASRRPNSSTAARIVASTSSSFVTSQCTGSTPAPTSAAVSFSAPLMSAATTCAPSRTKIFTAAFAIPEPAPMMTATFPSSSPMSRPPARSRIRARRMARIPPLSNRSAERPRSASGGEERPQVGDEEVGLLHRGEVAAARHLGPVGHVVPALDPGARVAQYFLRVAGHAGRHVDPLHRLGAVHVLPVEARRRRDRLRDPVRRDVREQLVACEDALRVAVAVAPRPELL